MKYFAKIALLTLLSFVVSGCVTTSQEGAPVDSELEQSFNREYAKCQAIKLTRKSAVARQTCDDNVLAMFAGRSPLFNVMAAQNRLAAIAYAEGKTSQAEFKATVDRNAATATLRSNQSLPASR